MTTTTSARAPTLAQVLEGDGRRPKAPGAWTTSLAFGWRALLRIKHIPEQLFDVTVLPLLFTLMFTYLFGGALAGSTEAYVQYLLPGIVVQTVAFVTMYTGQTMNRDVEKGVFDRFRSLPIWRPAPLVGALLGDVVRYSIAITITMVLGVTIGFRAHGGVLGVVAAAALMLVFAFAISWIWIMFAMILRSEQSVQVVAWLVLFPLTFGSNIFVDPATMPRWLRAFVEVNPISQLATAARGLMQGSVDAGAVGIVLAWSVALVVVFGPITMRLYNRKN